MKRTIVSALGNCSNLKCDCNPKKNSFINLTSPEVFILDEEIPGKTQPSRLVGGDQYYQVKVINKSVVPFVFVKVDACLITDDRKRCDAFIYTEKEFYFIEIKDVKQKSRTKARKQAYEQLFVTITRLKGVDYGGRILYAIVCLAKPAYSVVSSENVIQKVRFMNSFGVTLKQGSVITI